MLVVLDLGDNRCLRGVGLVRRASAAQDGRPAEVAVELSGMSEAEVARLVKETNAAARTEAVAGAGGSSRTT